MEDKYISREAVLNLIEHNNKVCHYAEERKEKTLVNYDPDEWYE